MSDRSNPANAPETRANTLGRIPMSVPQQKLTVPEIPGFHLHWMLGTPARLAQALRAGYVFVERDEVEVVGAGLADDLGEDGNTDIGSRVSVVAGGLSENGSALRLVLMKLKEEWWQEDQRTLESQSDALVTALRQGKMNASAAGETADDFKQRYVDRDRTSNMFTKRRA